MSFGAEQMAPQSLFEQDESLEAFRAIRTGPLTRHAGTNMAVIREFLGVGFGVAPSGKHGAVAVEVRRPA